MQADKAYLETSFAFIILKRVFFQSSSTEIKKTVKIVLQQNTNNTILLTPASHTSDSIAGPMQPITTSISPFTHNRPRVRDPVPQVVLHAPHEDHGEKYGQA